MSENESSTSEHPVKLLANVLDYLYLEPVSWLLRVSMRLDQAVTSALASPIYLIGDCSKKIHTFLFVVGLVWNTCACPRENDPEFFLV